MLPLPRWLKRHKNPGKLDMGMSHTMALLKCLITDHQEGRLQGFCSLDLRIECTSYKLACGFICPWLTKTKRKKEKREVLRSYSLTKFSLSGSSDFSVGRRRQVWHRE